MSDSMQASLKHTTSIVNNLEDSLNSLPSQPKIAWNEALINMLESLKTEVESLNNKEIQIRNNNILLRNKIRMLKNKEKDFKEALDLIKKHSSTCLLKI